MKIHMVKKGDTLYFIGQKYNVSLEEILKLNPGITNPDAIEVGTKLKIPSSHTGGSGGMDIMHQHVVKQGDTLWKLSKAWGVPLADMIKANPQLKNPNVLLTGEIVNIPKVGGVMTEAPAAPGTVGAHSLHPNSIMQNVQGWVGKLSTAPILGKTQTAPITGKTPTAPIEGKAPTAPIESKAPTAPITQLAPAAPAAPIAPPKAAPIQEKKPTAPIVKPVAPAAVPAPKPMAIEPAKKTLPIQKPVEKKLAPTHAEYKPNVDLFKQYGIPATEALSLYDLPKAPEAVSPAAQQPTYGGYGYGQPMTMPAQTGHGYGYGYNGWHQPVPFSNTVSPLGEGNDSFDCPPGTVLVGSYPSPSTMPLGAGPDWGYGNPMVSPLQQGVGENMVAGASAMPNQGMVSPLSAMPNQGMVSPLSAMPNQGMVSPLSAMPNQGMVSPLSAMPNQGMVSPLSAMPNQGMVSPLSAMPNQGMVSPLSAMPNQGMVSPFSAMPNQGMVSPLSEMPNQGMVSPFSAMPNQGMVSPANIQPEYEHGYGYGHGAVSPANVMPDYGYGYGHGMVSPANVQPDYGYGYGHSMVSPANVQQPDYGHGYGYPAAGLPPYPSYPGWPQTAGVGAYDKDCGCHGDRTEQTSAKLADTETPKSAKTGVQRKNTKKAVIRTVTTRQSKTRNRGSQPWLNN